MTNINTKSDKSDILEQIVLIPAKRIFGGQIEDLPLCALDKSLIPQQFLNTSLMLITTDHSKYVVDCCRNDIIQGRYIIEIEGRYSLNGLQRLPENKIAIQIIDTNIIINSEKMNIVGKVICSINEEY